MLTDAATLRALASRAEPPADVAGLVAMAEAMSDPDNAAAVSYTAWAPLMRRLAAALTAQAERVKELEGDNQMLASKIEAFDARDLGRAYLLRAGPQPDGFEMALRTGAAGILAEGLAEVLRAEDAPNFVTCSATHPDLGPIELTVRRLFGEASPQTVIATRTAERDAALARAEKAEALNKEAAGALARIGLALDSDFEAMSIGEWHGSVVPAADDARALAAKLGEE